MSGQYFVRKLISSLGILFVVVTLNFFLPRMVFDDPAQPYYTGIPEDEIALRAEIRKEYGFDRPVIVQYGIYLKKVVTLEFGTSHIYKAPVVQVIFQRIPWSMVLSLTSMVISVLLGILIGSICATNRGQWQDQLVLKLSNLSTAIPSFWLAMVFVMLFAFVVPIFPYRGAMTPGYQLVFNKQLFFVLLIVVLLLSMMLYLCLQKALIPFMTALCGFFVSVIASIPMEDTMDVLYHSILPLTVLVIGGVISYALLVRNSMITVVNEEYILTARAKGVPKRKILYGHTFRNALLPLVTNIGMSFAGVFGGSILIEKIFSWPGIGQLLNEANNAGDFQLAQAIMLFFSIVTIVVNFMTDMIYHKLDPRVTLQ